MQRITPEQAAEVDRVLARYSRYLAKLEARIKQLGVRHPECLPGWIEKTRWDVDGLRHHFGE